MTHFLIHSPVGPALTDGEDDKITRLRIRESVQTLAKVAISLRVKVRQAPVLRSLLPVCIRKLYHYSSTSMNHQLEFQRRFLSSIKLSAVY